MPCPSRLAIEMDAITTSHTYRYRAWSEVTLAIIFTASNYEDAIAT
jgi:hypothetical protein